MLESDLAGDRGRVDRVRPIERLRHEGEDFPHAPRARDCVLQLSRRVRDRRERAVHRGQIGDHHQQPADGEVTPKDVQPADSEHDGGATQA